jgi:hypothetical protein
VVFVGCFLGFIFFGPFEEAPPFWFQLLTLTAIALVPTGLLIAVIGGITWLWEKRRPWFGRQSQKTTKPGGANMTNPDTTSRMRPIGACALVAGIIVFMAKVAMSHSETIGQALVAGMSHPLVIITIPLGLYLLLRHNFHTAPSREPENDFPSLEPPPPFPAKPEASSTSPTSSHQR